MYVNSRPKRKENHFAEEIRVLRRMDGGGRERGKEEGRAMLTLHC